MSGAPVLVTPLSASNMRTAREQSADPSHFGLGVKRLRVYVHDLQHRVGPEDIIEAFDLAPTLSQRCQRRDVPLHRSNIKSMAEHGQKITLLCHFTRHGTVYAAKPVYIVHPKTPILRSSTIRKTTLRRLRSIWNRHRTGLRSPAGKSETLKTLIGRQT